MITKTARVVFALVLMLGFTMLCAKTGVCGERPSFFGLGGHASYYQTDNADNGNITGGLQARLRLTKALTIEGAADYRKDKFEGGDVDVEGYPFQLSVLFYVFKGSVIGPHLIFGGSWYSSNITVKQVNPGGLSSKYSSDDFGYHGGFGVDIQIGGNLYLHSDVRYMFLDVDFGDQSLDHNGFIIQAGLSYYF